MSKHPTGIHKSEWDRMQYNLKHKDIVRENAEKRTDYINSLNVASHNMTKLWTDSFEKLRQKQEEDAKMKKQKEEQARIEFYHGLMESKQKERERVLADARDIFFKQKDEPRILESAFMCAEMLKEQELQREFNKKMKIRETKIEKEYAKELNEKAKEWNMEQIAKYQRRRQKDHEEFLAVKTQAEDLKSRRRQEREEEILMEKQDNENAIKEIEALKNCSKEMKLKEQQANKNHIFEALELGKQRKEEKANLEKMEDKLIEIYNSTNLKIKQLRITKGKEIVAEKTRNRDKVRGLFNNTAKEIEAKETKILEKAKEEIEQRESELVRKKKEYQEAIKMERKRIHEDLLESEKQRAKDQATLRAWEIANRIKNDEHTRAHSEAIQNQKRRALIENKQFLRQQQRELAEEKAQMEVERIKFYHTDVISEMKAADDQFMTYANRLVEECEGLGRPTLPLQRVIKDYKVRYLQPEKRLSRHMKTHLPQCMASDVETNLESASIKK